MPSRSSSLLWNWFRQNPKRQFRVRRANSDEYSGEPSPGEWVYVIMHRDEIEEYWEHEFFKQRQYSNIDGLTDSGIREILHEVTGGRKC